jgi:hypothetical protein
MYPPGGVSSLSNLGRPKGAAQLIVVNHTTLGIMCSLEANDLKMPASPKSILQQQYLRQNEGGLLK